MNEQLISGYTAFTTADEYGTAVVGDAPATTPFYVLGLASYALSATLTHYANC